MRTRKIMKTVGIVGGGLAALLLPITGCAMGRTGHQDTAAAAIAPVNAALTTPAPQKVKRPIGLAGLRGRPLKVIYDGDRPNDIEEFENSAGQLIRR